MNHRHSTVLFVVPDDAHLLDLAGPAQVFSGANDFGADYQIRYVASRPTTPTFQGLDLATPTDWPALSVEDLVVVVGWRVSALPLICRVPEHLLRSVAAHHTRGGRVASVCAGAIALAESGILQGRTATTHHALGAAFARMYPDIRVVQDVLYVGDDRIYTSAGVASGIDLALHLVAVDHGPATAAKTARALVLAARRNGETPQESAMLRHRDHLVDLVHKAQDLIDDRFAEPLPLESVAAQLAVSPRTLTRAFSRATGTTPLTYQTSLRLEYAQGLIDQGWTRERAAHQVGFSDARMLRRLRARSVHTRTLTHGDHVVQDAGASLC